MRSFVFLLILANLMFFAWTQGVLGVSSNSEAFRMQQQLLAEQVTVVARDVPPPETGPAEVAVKTIENKSADTCILLSDWPSATADQLESRLAEKFSAFKVSRTQVASGNGYWVFIPPLANKKDVDSKVADLKKLGVTEFFVVQESGANNRAISLGVFSGKDAATAFLEKLRAKGVKSAKVAERPAKESVATLEIRGPEAQADAVRQAVVEVLPEAKPGACKTQTESAQ